MGWEGNICEGEVVIQSYVRTTSPGRWESGPERLDYLERDSDRGVSRTVLA